MKLEWSYRYHLDRLLQTHPDPLFGYSGVFGLTVSLHPCSLSAVRASHRRRNFNALGICCPAHPNDVPPGPLVT